MQPSCDCRKRYGEHLLALCRLGQEIPLEMDGNVAAQFGQIYQPDINYVVAVDTGSFNPAVLPRHDHSSFSYPSTTGHQGAETLGQGCSSFSRSSDCAPGMSSYSRSSNRAPEMSKP